MRKNKLLNSFTTFLFYISILFFFLSFDFQDSRSGGWYQQFLSNLNGSNISDITFLDSLTGYAVTPYIANDTAYIIKTTNGGDNWFILFRQPTNNVGGFNRIQFINQNTGFTCGNFLWKTTNGGINWFNVNTSGIFPENMWIISQDTIWITDHNSLTGGAFLSTNGGVSWSQKYSAGSLNPDKIYFYNSRIGFIGLNGGTRYIAKTTNGGDSWTTILNNDYFQCMYFYDSLLGWKSSAFGMKKTTNGGINWVTQTLPSGGIVQESFIYSFSNVNKDTIWGCGGYVLLPNGTRDLLHRTTNGGTNWFNQLPDTSINVGYAFARFTNKLNGWFYDNFSPKGIHTKVGGDTTFLSKINQISNFVPCNFKLYQNYPNPFNPTTNIKYKIEKTAEVKIIVFDIRGKEITTLINTKQTSGSYEVRFDGSNFSSGVYFYTLFIDGNRIDTKKAVLIK
jgi:photosystem II stability/assembly factor-like uncharacterized protein